MTQNKITLQDYINADYDTLVSTPLKKLRENKAKNITNNFREHRFLNQYSESKAGYFKNVPVGIKDMVSMAGYEVTLGSNLFKENVTKEDAEVISNLKKSGFNILSALSMHELAYGITGDRSSTGPIKNYKDDNLMAGGSSSGSAVAVALGIVPLALGTDTSGSIRVPAAFNDVVGFKPVYKDISTEGVYPLSKTLDHVGPITNNVTDSFIGYRLMKGERIGEGDLEIPKTDVLSKSILIPKLEGMFEFEEGILNNFNEVIKIIKELGLKIREVELPNFEEILEHQKAILKYEAYQLYKNKISSESGLDEEVFERIHFGQDVEEDQYEEAITQRDLLTEDYNRLIGDDVLFLPTMLIYPKKLQERTVNIGKYSHLRDCMFNLTAPFNYLKLPVLSMPSNLSEDENFNSLQFVGSDNNELLLFQLGHLMEQEIEKKKSGKY